MAKNKHYRWRDWRVDARGTSITDRGDKKRNKSRSGAGITNGQATYLAKLQRQAGLKYTGSGMSKTDAAALISRLVDERDARREARPMRQPVRSLEGWTPAEQAIIEDAMSRQVLPPAPRRRKSKKRRGSPFAASGAGPNWSDGDQLDVDWSAKLDDEAA